MTTGYEHGGPFLGSGDPTGATAQLPRYVKWRQRHPRTFEWLRSDNQLRDNIVTASEYFSNEYVSAGSQAERDNIEEMANIHMSELAFAHMPADVAWEMDPPGWSWLLPTPELLESWSGTAVGFYQTVIDYEWSRNILKDMLGNAAATTGAAIIEAGTGHLVKRDFPRIHTISKLARAGGILGAAWQFNSWLNTVKNTSKNLFDRSFDQGQEPLEEFESYRAPREWEGYEEGSMPYNRRTGQWYPARRYGGSSYNRGYRRYGNRRYGNSGGYAPRRRRSYSRW